MLLGPPQHGHFVQWDHRGFELRGRSQQSSDSSAVGFSFLRQLMKHLRDLRWWPLPLSQVDGPLGSSSTAGFGFHAPLISLGHHWWGTSRSACSLPTFTEHKTLQSERGDGAVPIKADPAVPQAASYTVTLTATPFAAAASSPFLSLLSRSHYDPSSPRTEAPVSSPASSPPHRRLPKLTVLLQEVGRVPFRNRLHGVGGEAGSGGPRSTQGRPFASARRRGPRSKAEVSPIAP